MSRLRQLCRRILLGTPSPPRVFCHQAHSPEPHPSLSARLPQRQGQIPGRCPGVRGTVCLWGRALPRALLLHACVFSPEPGSACTPLWTFQDAQLLLILGHWSLPCHWPRLHPPPHTHPADGSLLLELSSERLAALPLARSLPGKIFGEKKGDLGVEVLWIRCHISGKPVSTDLSCTRTLHQPPGVAGGLRRDWGTAGGGPRWCELQSFIRWGRR